MPRVYPNCCICFSNDENEWSSLRCGHVFHTVCLSQSLRQCGKKCPKCRKDGSKPQRLFLEFEEEQTFAPAQTSDSAFQALQKKHQELNVEHGRLHQKASDLEEKNTNLSKKVQRLEAQLVKAEQEQAFLSQRLHEAQQHHAFDVAQHADEKARLERVIDNLESKMEQIQSQLDDEKAKLKQLEAIRLSKVSAERLAKNPKMDPVLVAGLLEACNQEDLKKLVKKRNDELVESGKKMKELQTQLVEANEKWSNKLTALEKKAGQEREGLTRDLEKSKRKLNQYELELDKLQKLVPTEPAEEVFVFKDHDGAMEPTPEDLNTGDEEQTQEDFDIENDEPDQVIPTRVATKPSLMGFSKGGGATEPKTSFMGKVDPYVSGQNTSTKFGLDRSGRSHVLAPLSSNKFKAVALQGPLAKKAKKGKPGGVATLHQFGFCRN